MTSVWFLLQKPTGTFQWNVTLGAWRGSAQAWAVFSSSSSVADGSEVTGRLRIVKGPLSVDAARSLQERYALVERLCTTLGLVSMSSSIEEISGPSGLNVDDQLPSARRKGSYLVLSLLADRAPTPSSAGTFAGSSVEVPSSAVISRVEKTSYGSHQVLDLRRALRAARPESLTLMRAGDEWTVPTLASGQRMEYLLLSLVRFVSGVGDAARRNFGLLPVSGRMVTFDFERCISSGLKASNLLDALFCKLPAADRAVMEAVLRMPEPSAQFHAALHIKLGSQREHMPPDACARLDFATRLFLAQFSAPSPSPPLQPPVLPSLEQMVVPGSSLANELAKAGGGPPASSGLQKKTENNKKKRSRPDSSETAKKKKPAATTAKTASAKRRGASEQQQAKLKSAVGECGSAREDLWDPRTGLRAMALPADSPEMARMPSTPQDTLGAFLIAGLGAFAMCAETGHITRLRTSAYTTLLEELSPASLLSVGPRVVRSVERIERDALPVWRAHIVAPPMLEEQQQAVALRLAKSLALVLRELAAIFTAFVEHGVTMSRDIALWAALSPVETELDRIGDYHPFAKQAKRLRAALDRSDVSARVAATELFRSLDPPEFLKKMRVQSMRDDWLCFAAALVKLEESSSAMMMTESSPREEDAATCELTSLVSSLFGSAAADGSSLARAPAVPSVEYHSATTGFVDAAGRSVFERVMKSVLQKAPRYGPTGLVAVLPASAPPGGGPENPLVQVCRSLLVLEEDGSRWRLPAGLAVALPDAYVKDKHVDCNIGFRKFFREGMRSRRAGPDIAVGPNPDDTLYLRAMALYFQCWDEYRCAPCSANINEIAKRRAKSAADDGEPERNAKQMRK